MRRREVLGHPERLARRAPFTTLRGGGTRSGTETTAGSWPPHCAGTADDRHLRQRRGELLVATRLERGEEVLGACSRRRPRVTQVHQRVDAASPAAQAMRHSPMSSMCSSCTSKSRTSPSTAASHPSSYGPCSRAPAGRRRTGRWPRATAGGDPHVVQLLDVLAQSGPGLPGEEGAEVRRSTAKASSPSVESR